MSEFEGQFHNLEMDAEQALFSGQIRGLAVVLYRNERPLGGLAGLLDWRFHGAISSYLRTGAVSGELGECAYVPISRHGATYHLIFVGAGDCAAHGKRPPPPAKAVSAAQNNLASLGLEKIALSRADFGGLSDEALQNSWKGPLWIVR